MLILIGDSINYISSMFHSPTIQYLDAKSPLFFTHSCLNLLIPSCNYFTIVFNIHSFITIYTHYYYYYYYIIIFTVILQEITSLQN